MIVDSCPSDSGDAVLCLQDENIQPVADVGGDHVHQPETGHQLVLVDVHLNRWKVYIALVLVCLRLRRIRVSSMTRVIVRLLGLALQKLFLIYMFCESNVSR